MRYTPRDLIPRFVTLDFAMYLRWCDDCRANHLTPVRPIDEVLPSDDPPLAVQTFKGLAFLRTMFFSEPVGDARHYHRPSGDATRIYADASALDTPPPIGVARGDLMLMVDWPDVTHESIAQALREFVGKPNTPETRDAIVKALSTALQPTFRLIPMEPDHDETDTGVQP